MFPRNKRTTGPSSVPFIRALQSWQVNIPGPTGTSLDTWVKSLGTPISFESWLFGCAIGMMWSFEGRRRKSHKWIPSKSSSRPLKIWMPGQCWLVDPLGLVRPLLALWLPNAPSSKSWSSMPQMHAASQWLTTWPAHWLATRPWVLEPGPRCSAVPSSWMSAMAWLVVTRGAYKLWSTSFRWPRIRWFAFATTEVINRSASWRTTVWIWDSKGPKIFQWPNASNTSWNQKGRRWKWQPWKPLWRLVGKTFDRSSTTSSSSVPWPVATRKILKWWLVPLRHVPGFCPIIANACPSINAWTCTLWILTWCQPWCRSVQCQLHLKMSISLLNRYEILNLLM